MPYVSLTNAHKVSLLDIERKLDLTGFGDGCNQEYTKDGEKTWLYWNSTTTSKRRILYNETTNRWEIVEPASGGGTPTNVFYVSSDASLAGHPKDVLSWVQGPDGTGSGGTIALDNTALGGTFDIRDFKNLTELNIPHHEITEIKR